jgi:hypothetical protein
MGFKFSLADTPQSTKDTILLVWAWIIASINEYYFTQDYLIKSSEDRQSMLDVFNTFDLSQFDAGDSPKILSLALLK